MGLGIRIDFNQLLQTTSHCISAFGGRSQREDLAKFLAVRSHHATKCICNNKARNTVFILRNGRDYI